MNYRFETLTSIFFKHKYFLNEKFQELKAKPSGKSIYMMTKMGFLFKSNKDGFSVLYNTGFAGQKRERNDILSKDTFTLRFYLMLHAPSFYNYTANVSGDLTKSIFYFTNGSQSANVALPEGMLHAEKAVSEKDLYPLEKFREQVLPKPFGLLDLYIHSEMKETYVINFSAKATFWRYILVSDYLKDLQKPAILNLDKHEFFEGPAALTLPDGKDVLYFTSKGKINLSESIPWPMRLVDSYEPETGKYKTIIATLPLPDIRTISHIGAINEQIKQSEFSEIFIY